MAENLTTYSSNSNLQDIKASKHSAFEFGQQNRFSKVYQKIFFVLQIENYWEILKSKGSLVMTN